ncbi:transporter substrate-binding domain-containing protein [Methanorbis rubei]
MVLLVLGAAVVAAGCIQEKPVYTVGISSSFAPFSIQILQTEEAYGIDVDLLNAIGKDQGIEFIYEFWEHADCPSKLTVGEIDLITATVKTPEHQKKYLLSDPYITAGYAVVIRKNANVTMDDVLAGNVTITCERGSIYETWLKEHFGTETFNKMIDEKKIIIKYTQDATLYAVLTNEAEAVIGADNVLGDKLREYSPLTFLGYLSDKKDVVFASNKSNEELIAKINAGLKNVVASGEYDKILQKHYVAQLKDEYRVGISTENWPFTYLDEDGNLTGYDIEALEWIAERNGFTVTYVDIPWSKNINAIVTGKIDMWYSGMIITDDRESRVTFSTPYYTAGLGIGCAGDHLITKTQFESGTAVTGFITRTIIEEWLTEQFGKDQYEKMVKAGVIKEYASYNDLLDACNAGEIDCIAVSEPLLKVIANETDIEIVSTYETGDRGGVAIQNGNIPLQDVINRGLADLEASGKRAELMEKYHLS